MQEELGDWPDSYSNPMGDNDHHTKRGDIGYDGVYSSFPAELDSFLHHDISNFLHPGSFNDASYAHDALFDAPLGSLSTDQRQQPIQPLYIDTQLNRYSISDSDSSTASSISIPQMLITPSGEMFPVLPPSVHISSPQSASAEQQTLMLDLKMMSPFPVSPISPYSPVFGGENAFDLPKPLTHTSDYPVESDVMTQVPMPHILEWKRVIEICGTNDFVPQVVYQPYTEADKKRYIRDVELQDTIFFQSADSTELGTSLDDALRQRLKHLKDKDDRMFVGCGPSVSIRVQWPGYPSWSKQIPTKDFRNPKGQITRAKLAKNIATCIRRFVEEMQDKPMEAESDKRWKIGQQHIRVEQLILVSLHHVSKGSWQPQLRIRGPLAVFPHQTVVDNHVLFH